LPEVDDRPVSLAFAPALRFAAGRLQKSLASHP
jgi:hypothetical protein